VRRFLGWRFGQLVDRHDRNPGECHSGDCHWDDYHWDDDYGDDDSVNGQTLSSFAFEDLPSGP
jgi:hypothetical protein